MSKYDIAIFIVCSIEGFICYLIGYKIGITHEKRTNTHECVKDTHYKTEPTISKMEQVEDEPQIFICPIQNDYEALIEYEPQTGRSSE